MKTYVVKFWGGGGGNLIQELILWCETQSSLLTSYELAHAHHNDAVLRWKQANIEHCVEIPGEYQFDTDRLRSTSTSNFIITPGYSKFNIQQIYEKDPDNFRMIYIIAENALEVALCEYNHFYKNQRLENQDYELYQHYQALVNLGKITPIDDVQQRWQDLTTEDVRLILIERTRQLCQSSSNMLSLKSSYFYQGIEQYRIPFEELTVSEIMSGSERVLDVVNKVVGKPITTAMKTNLATYAESQHKLHNKFPAYQQLASTYPSWMS